MQLPAYWLTRPSNDLDDAARSAFDRFFDSLRDRDDCPTLNYNLPWPLWQFLCYIADQHKVVLHGSGNSEIHLFEPRQPLDLTEFGSQKAIYAASDGLWAMFFAVVDRDRYELSVANACIRILDQTGPAQGPFYVFSVSRALLPQKPWRTGTVYLLPHTSFHPQEPIVVGETRVQIAQLVSFEPVKPLAKVVVTPEDFPLLDAIRGHDDQRLAEYAAAMQYAQPWPDTADD